MNRTHAPDRQSWVESANAPNADFPIQNLPFGVFRRESHELSRLGVAIGDQILDLRKCASQNLLPSVCAAHTLNPVMAMGRAFQWNLRKLIFELLAENAQRRPEMLVPMSSVEMLVPAEIGDFTDFYASIHHATRVGQLFRPENPLLPNYRYVPIAYHGRSSSIVASGTEVRRPCGQIRPDPGAPPVFAPSRRLDFELELGFFAGAGNVQGEPIRCDHAERYMFGACLVNDWSARDIQEWEYQPLGPFLAKSFATTVSPWVVTLDALEPFRCAPSAHDPEPLEYLRPPGSAFDIQLEVLRNGVLLTRGNAKILYWTPAQMVAHHTSNGCNLRPGDLLATGTISGEDRESAGCLLELGGGFLNDGDEITFRAFCEADGFARIGFGDCSGKIR